MQEEVENRTLTLGINTTKFTGRVLKAALSKYLAHRKEKKLQASRDSPDVKSFGKVTMEELQKDYGDVRDSELLKTDKSWRDFDRIAREYGVRYAVKKKDADHYRIFFKAPNEANMSAAFEKFTALKIRKAERRESVLGKLEKFKALVKNAVTDRTRRKELER